MTKIMIIEDDFIVRQYLRNAINWGAHDIEITGEASNGETALELLKSMNVDIIITDMSMPGMDGISLIKRIKELYPTVKIIVLSCRDDFSLVKDAMKYGAVEYILKHTMEPDSLIETVKNVTSIKKDDKLVELKNLKSEAISNVSYNHRVIEDLLKGVCCIDEKKVTNKLQKMNINIGMNNLYVINIDIQDRGVFKDIASIEDLELYKFSVLNAIDNVMDGIDTYNSVYINNMFVIILSFEKYKSAFQMQNILRNTVNFINEQMVRTLNMKAFFTVSDLLKNITELSLGYEQCLNVIKYKIYKMDTYVMFYSEINRSYSLGDIKAKINCFKVSLSNGNYIEGENVLNEVFELIRQLMVSVEDLAVIFIELLNIVSRMAEELGLHAIDVFGTEAVPYNKINKFTCIKELFSWYMSIFGLIKKRVVMQSAGRYRKEVRSAIDYISKNLEREITLNEVSNQVNMSAVYFSQLFKQQTGINFSEYLSKVRIDHAKKLLEETDMKVYEVAYKSGFSQPQYFIKVFKDAVGMTPLDFRNCSLG